MAEEQAKGVPESVLKKQKRNEEWALAKKQEFEAAKKKNLANRKLIYNRAKQYAKEYAEQVAFSYFHGTFDIVLKTCYFCSAKGAYQVET